MMIKRETRDGICTLTFDRPESGANIFDAATMDSLREHLEAIETNESLKGVIVTSAKKSIFIAGADLQTLLRRAQSGSRGGGGSSILRRSGSRHFARARPRRLRRCRG